MLIYSYSSACHSQNAPLVGMSLRGAGGCISDPSSRSSDSQMPSVLWWDAPRDTPSNAPRGGARHDRMRGSQASDWLSVQLLSEERCGKEKKRASPTSTCCTGHPTLTVSTHFRSWCKADTRRLFWGHRAECSARSGVSACGLCRCGEFGDRWHDVALPVVSSRRGGGWKVSLNLYMLMDNYRGDRPTITPGW